MSDLTYREADCKHSGWRATKLGHPQCLDCGGIERYVIPDVRLQAIADAAGEPFMWCFTHGQRRVQCGWARKLYECSDVDDAVIVRASLLDAKENELLSSADQREVPHLFTGRTDRWCTTCNLPDRNPIHQGGQR